jgi:hypothetical protein
MPRPRGRPPKLKVDPTASIQARRIPDELWLEIMFHNERDDLADGVTGEFDDLLDPWTFHRWDRSYDCKITRRKLKCCARSLGLACKWLHCIVNSTSRIWITVLWIDASLEVLRNIAPRILKAIQDRPSWDKCDFDMSLKLRDPRPPREDELPRDSSLDSIVQLFRCLCSKWRNISFDLSRDSERFQSELWAQFLDSKPTLQRTSRFHVAGVTEHHADELPMIDSNIKLPSLADCRIRGSLVSDLRAFVCIQHLEISPPNRASDVEEWTKDLLSHAPPLQDLKLYKSISKDSATLPPRRYSNTPRPFMHFLFPSNPVAGGKFRLTTLQLGPLTARYLEMISRYRIPAAFCCDLLDCDLLDSHCTDLGVALQQQGLTSFVLRSGLPWVCPILGSSTRWNYLTHLYIIVSSCSVPSVTKPSVNLNLIELPLLQTLAIEDNEDGLFSPSPFLRRLLVPMLSTLAIAVSWRSIAEERYMREFPSFPKLQVLRIREMPQTGTPCVLTLLGRWNLPSVVCLDIDGVIPGREPRTWTSWSAEPKHSLSRFTELSVLFQSEMKKYISIVIPSFKNLEVLNLSMENWTPGEKGSLDIMEVKKDGHIILPHLRHLKVCWLGSLRDKKEGDLRFDTLESVCRTRHRAKFSLSHLTVLQYSGALREDQLARLRLHVSHSVTQSAEIPRHLSGWW